MDITRETALVHVNVMMGQMRQLAQTIAAALEDGKVSPLEGFQLGLAGMQFGNTLLYTLRGLDKPTREAMLAILQEGHWAV